MLKIRKKLAEKKEASKGIAKAGFTLIELLVVIAILAILVLLAAPRFLGYTKDADVRAMQADAKVLANSALIYNIENEDWPTTGDEGTVVTIGEVEVKGKKLNSNAENGLGNHVQTLKGKFDDYALVTKDTGDITVIVGKNEDGSDKTAKEKLQVGDIVYVGNGKAGVEDKDKKIHYAVNVKVAKPAKPAEGSGQ